MIQNMISEHTLSCDPQISPSECGSTAKSTLRDTTNAMRVTTCSVANNLVRKAKVSPKELTKRRQRRRRQMAKEFDNLRSLLPTLRESKAATEVDIVYEAAKYIDELHVQILKKILLQNTS